MGSIVVEQDAVAMGIGGSSEGSFLMTKQGIRKHVVIQTSHIDGYHGTSQTTRSMNRLRNQLFACSGLTGNKDRLSGVAHGFNNLEQCLHPVTTGNYVAEAVWFFKGLSLEITS